MIGNLFGDGDGTKIPRSIKDGVTGMRLSMQRSLRDRKSRVEINLPPGIALGVEGPATPAIAKESDKFESNNREVARLVVELFQPIIENTVVIFQTSRQQRIASTVWGPSLVKTMSFEELGSSASMKKKNKKKKKSGFGGDDGIGGGDVLPPGTECCIIVAPSPQELAIVKKMSDSLGFDTLMIIVNTPLDKAAPYMDKDVAKALLQEFETIFNLTPVSAAEIKTLDNMLIYRSYPQQWQIALKGALGPPQVLAKSDSRFGKEEIMDALKKGAEINAKPAMEKILGGLFGG